MENPQPSFLQRLTGSPVLLIGGVVVLLLIVIASGVFLYLQKSETKPPLDPIPQGAMYKVDEIIVKFNEGYLPSPQGQNPKWDKLHEKLSSLGVEKYEPVFESKDPALQYHYRLTLKKGSDVQKIREEIYKLDEIGSSEPNYFLKTQAVPNDPLYPSMWDLQKIQMENAWNIQTGSNDVIVAVIDSGVDYTHSDFVGRRFVHGKDFVTCDDYVINKDTSQILGCREPKSMDDDPMDNLGHGTHVAGTIGAVSNNSEGISGINWNISLMALKTQDKNGNGSGIEIPKAIEYAVDNGADVINMSLGGPGVCSQGSVYETAITYAVSKGVVVVVAAGNDSKDASGYIPASCKGVIVVGATGPNDERASYSNYGSIVTIAAPGGNQASKCTSETCISSTYPQNQYTAMKGTSMASPHVAGVAALLLAQNPSLTPDDVKRCLVESGDPISTDKPIGGKRLNAYKALNGCVKSNNPGVTTGVTPPETAITAAPVSDEQRSYYIKGQVYRDTNKNGKKDTNESALNGAVVSLSGPVSRDPIQVGPDGLFMFSGLESGSYRVETFVNRVAVMEYRFALNATLPNIELPVPVMVDPPQDTSPNIPKSPITGKTTVTPTPRQLFTCKEETTSRQVNNKTIQIKYLKCTPKQ